LESDVDPNNNADLKTLFLLTENTSHLLHNDHSINPFHGNNRFLFGKPYKNLNILFALKD
jgi:hypothetical protein